MTVTVADLCNLLDNLDKLLRAVLPKRTEQGHITFLKKKRYINILPLFWGKVSFPNFVFTQEILMRGTT